MLLFSLIALTHAHQYDAAQDVRQTFSCLLHWRSVGYIPLVCNVMERKADGPQQASRGDGEPHPRRGLALFFEKGYDNTSIQDIIDGLGGLTKGAVYHHFKSKEDILSLRSTATTKRCSTSFAASATTAA